MTCRYALTVAALTASLSVSAAGTALADTIIQIQAVSAGSFGATGVTPFDPALGTLDSVFVGISGQLSVTGSTLPNIVDNVPVPYPFQVKVTQDYFGLGGRYFHFSTPAEFTFFGNATGTGEPLIIVSQFTYGFSFTSITDLLGFTLPSVSTSSGVLAPPLDGIVGLRSDFLRSIFPIDEIDLVQSWTSLAFGGVGPPIINDVSTNGILEIDYNYTPTPVPEPTTLTLLGSGIVAGWWRARKRFISSSVQSG